MSIWKNIDDLENEEKGNQTGNDNNEDNASSLSDLFQDAFNKGKEIIESAGTEIFSAGKDFTVKTSTSSGEAPKINIVEDHESFKVYVAAPGYEKKDFRVNIENSALIISSDKESEELKDAAYVLKEFGLQPFKRSFTINEKVDSNKIEAAYKEGILLIKLGKKDAFIRQPGKEIEIS